MPDVLDEPDMTPVGCLDCDWIGFGYQLIAQACPICDGRVQEEPDRVESA